MNDPSVPQRRAGDQGRWARALDWWRRNGGIIVGPWLLIVSVVVVGIALEMRENTESRARDTAVVRKIAETQAEQQKVTARAARLSCERSREYGPALADYYARERVLPLQVIDEYRRTIPKTCPK